MDDIGILLQKAVRTFQMLEKKQIRMHGFTSSQCYILLEIYKHQTLSINEISEKMRLEISTITRIMNNLVRDELILRKRSVYDKRVVEAILTENGKEIAQQLQKSIANYYKDVIANLPRGHVREVMSAVELLVNALEKAQKG
ncbi:MarR family winged helix-turn-helix transcriptional regulator [Sporomusa silvacetica]|nr:MarR family transcriptional regulator [Sporomusa silvacetica]